MGLGLLRSHGCTRAGSARSLERTNLDLLADACLDAAQPGPGREPRHRPAPAAGLHPGAGQPRHLLVVFDRLHIRIHTQLSEDEILARLLALNLQWAGQGWRVNTWRWSQTVRSRWTTPRYPPPFARCCCAMGHRVMCCGAVCAWALGPAHWPCRAGATALGWWLMSAEGDLIEADWLER